MPLSQAAKVGEFFRIWDYFGRFRLIDIFCCFIAKQNKLFKYSYLHIMATTCIMPPLTGLVPDLQTSFLPKYRLYGTLAP